jgi:glycine/D-amino acid oxidase-like deaminating enzyme
LRIKAPWIKNVWMFGSNYLIPNIDSIVVGGTQQKGDWNTIPSLEDTESILKNVCSLFPSLRDAQIVNNIHNRFWTIFNSIFLIRKLFGQDCDLVVHLFVLIARF